MLPMDKTSLPPGFRFHPTDVELTVYYLKRKLLGKRLRCDAVTDIDLYKFAPWDLPEKASLASNDRVWYFFCQRDRKYSSGVRTNRSTGVGYWKATGKDRPVVYNSKTVGMKRTLVFHSGKPPKGDRTDWVMYEYRLEDKEIAASGVKLDACVLCKIFHKSGLGPKIGAQYGAPFNEEDWSDANSEHPSPAPCVAPCVAPCSAEPTHGGLNPAGQRLVVGDDGDLYLGVLSESNMKHAADCVRPDRISLGVLSKSNIEHAPDCVRPDRTSPDIPFDCVHLQQLAEIINCSSMNYLCAADEDGSQPDSTVDYDNNNGILLDDSETIFSELDEPASQPVESNCNHCDSCGRHLIQPVLEAVGSEQYLELNDLSFSLADNPNSCAMLLSSDLHFQDPLGRAPRFEQDSQDSNVSNPSTTTTSGSPPVATSDHGT